MKKGYILISSLFILSTAVLLHFIAYSYRKEIDIEENRIRRYLSSSVSLSLSTVQDEIIFLYHNMSAMVRNSNNGDILTDLQSGKLEFKEEHLSPEFPEIVEYLYYIKLDSMFDAMPVYDDVIDENLLLNNLHHWEIYGKPLSLEIINIHNLSGFMAFPLDYAYENAPRAILMIGLDLREVIYDYVPPLIRRKLKESNRVDDGNIVDFHQAVMSGEVLSSHYSEDKYDLIIDLNTVFNLQEIETYFRTRTEREFQKLKSAAFISDHNYLVLSHDSGNITSFLQYKYWRFVLTLVLVALLLVSSFQLIGFARMKTLQNSQREQEFMSLISHELNTPLSVISLCAENLSKGFYSREKGIEYYGDMITKEIGRLRNMISNILMITTGSYKYKHNKFKREDLSDILSDVKELASELLEVNKVLLEVCDSAVCRSIYCSRHLLVLALFNVLANSVKYGAEYAEKKYIYIEVSNKDRKNKKIVSFIIRDFGPGIGAVEGKRIFHQFYRGKVAKSKQLSGSGLGLPLSRIIMKEHKGNVTLYPVEGAGAAFELWLPSGECL